MSRMYTLLDLVSDDKDKLTVGGGNGKFVVFLTNGNDFYTLLSLNKGDDVAAAIPLTIGGQEGEYPPDEVVDERSAMECALTYLKTGKRDQRYNWRRS